MRVSGKAKRGWELDLLQRDGVISDLRKQVKYELIPKQNGERNCCYVADFVYQENGKTVVEDSKGYKTSEFVIKRKLMLFIHGIKVREV